MNEHRSCLWCNYSGSLLAGATVTPINPQLTVPHHIRICPRCNQAMLDMDIPGRTIRRKAQEYKRRFRRSLWVVIYPIKCGWCSSTDTEAYDINATIANPLSSRLKYDVYRCNACENPSIISYLGEISVYRGRQDFEFPSLWYIEEGNEVRD